MAHRLNHVARARLALRPYHRRALRNATQRLAKVTRTTHKRHLERRLVNVVQIVRRRQNLALVNVVNLNRLQNLCLRKVTNTALRHDRNGHRLLDPANHLRVAHARNTASSTDVRRNALQRHHRARTRLLRYLRLLRIRHVHDDATLQHLSQIPIQFRLGRLFHLQLPLLYYNLLTILPLRRFP